MVAQQARVLCLQGVKHARVEPAQLFDRLAQWHRRKFLVALQALQEGGKSGGGRGLSLAGTLAGHSSAAFLGIVVRTLHKKRGVTHFNK